MSDFDATVSALKAALEVAPDNHPLRLHLAQLLRANGREKEAEVECRVALDRLKEQIERRPADASLYEQLATVQQALGDEAGSLTSQGIAIALRGVPAIEVPPTSREISDEDIDEMVRHDMDIITGQLRMGGEEEIPPEPMLAERPGITFADVGGMEEIKERIRMAIIYPFQHPEVFAAYGKRAGGGLLLYGPPGCGKTYIARATAGEVGASFISVGINDVLDMWFGESEHKLHAIFETARRTKPAVLFFDELEALGGNRLDMRQQFQRTVVNQFLAELDGAQGENADILVIGATNSPWHVEPALRRPGRFDRILFVAPPDEPARREILRLHLMGKPAAEDVDVAPLARETEGYSGADLRALVDVAVEEALQQAMRTGKIMPLSTAMLLRALKSHKPSTLEWLSTAKNFTLYSNEGGLYDDVAAYLRKRKMMR
jgi:SpoVK/Ycf46/Vps4 family AAA+-type ATPase